MVNTRAQKKTLAEQKFFRNTLRMRTRTRGQEDFRRALIAIQKRTPLPERVNIPRGVWVGTALSLAVRFGSLSTVMDLIMMGAPVDAKLRRGGGWTPLLIAAKHGHEDIMSVLMQRGASADVGALKGIPYGARAELRKRLDKCKARIPRAL